MAYECRVERDSINEWGNRLTTFVLTYPRIIHSEFMTHRMLSRNAASSRAIPVEKMIARIMEDPFIPVYWGKNQKGMQAEEELSSEQQSQALKSWLWQRDDAVVTAQELMAIGVHKQIANRLLEPFSWITVVASATDWANFFALRCHKDAQPEFQKLAHVMRDAREASKPAEVKEGQWHLPFIEHVDWYAAICACDNWQQVTEKLKLISTGRCARVSYLTHDGKREPGKDVELANRLIASTPKHASPFEHVATPCRGSHGNFNGWKQFRKEVPQETICD